MEVKPFAGKNALVTGSYRNLGAVTAETLAEQGANVILNDQPAGELIACGQQLLQRIKSRGVKALAIPADLNDSHELRRMCRQALEAFPHIDIVVNNAGPFNMDPYLKLQEQTWDLVMNVNLKAIYLVAQELAPRMKENGWGRIINLCAGSAYLRNHGVYTLAKAGVEILTESLALELGPEINVNAVAPGQIRESLPDIQQIDPDFAKRYLPRVPTGRLVTRRQIAEMIVFLCSPAADAVNGQTIKCSGGAEIPRF